MKRFSIALLACALVFLACEAASSFVLYRYYSFRGNSLTPSGSATGTLASLVVTRLRRGSATLKVTADHGPVFVPHPVLGYAMQPGDFTITETFRDHAHRFHLRIDALQRRVTSYADVHAGSRLLLTGDSALFGWGLNDQETIGWLLQQRLPDYEVINLSVTGYSTVDSLLQLQAIKPALNADDVVILMYHPNSNKYNVAAPETMAEFLKGIEIQLAAPEFTARTDIPFGAIDADGQYRIHRINLSCAKGANGACENRVVSDSDSAKVTNATFDKILELRAPRFMVALMSGGDDDPVVAHLRSRGVRIVDLRTEPDDPNADDVMMIDGHNGPFKYHDQFLRLLEALRSSSLVD